MSSIFDLLPAEPSPTTAPDLGLRWYQEAARKGVQEVHSRHRGALVVHPTGAGKSRLAGAVSWDHRLRGGKVLILTPTITLTLQMYTDMRSLGLTAGIEQASNHVQRPLPAVTVACVDTMRGHRLRSFQPDDFSLVIADEAHRSTSNKYTSIFSHFASAKLLGLTATPDRADGVSLRNVFDELAHELTMLKAIEEGWLVPLKFKTAVTNFDPKRLRTLAGEVDAGSVAEEITRSGLLHEAASSLAELSEGERTVAFLPTVASSKAFVAEMSARGIPAQHIDGTTPAEYREQVFKMFVAGQVRVLSNVGVLTEGWDCPAASVIALLNPTKSRSRVAQMIGRGTRLMEGKASTLVIDFCPGRLRKGRLASPADALAGRMLDDSVAEHLPSSGDLAEAIEAAEKTAAEIQQKKEQALETAKRRAERIASMKGLVTVRDQVDFSVEEHDALAVLSGVAGDGQSVMRTAKPQLTNEQRIRAGLATEKQAKILARHGMNPYLRRKLANEVIDAIANNSWKLPDHIKSDKRFYAGTKERVAAEAKAIETLRRLGLAV